MKIAVIGTGYVGLVAGMGFAETGNDVMCVDIDKDKIDMLNRGELPIYEPGLQELVQRNTEEGRLKFTTDLHTSVNEALVIFVAVGTPQSHDGQADLKYVIKVAEDVGRAMESYKIIVIKSTVPVCTSDKVRAAISGVTSQKFDMVSNPEFLKEGAAVDDFLKPDRIVIGTDDVRVAEIMKELYSPFVRTGAPIMVMDIKSAEMTKYASNALLATRITFMNEVANLCAAVGANVDLVRKGVGSDKRLGPAFLFPGVGYGGSCFPKDVRALASTAKEFGLRMKIIEAVDEVNDMQKAVLLKKIDRFMGEIKGKKIAVWGLAFKPRTDDMREAPSITVINGLLERGAEVHAYDPEATHIAKDIFGEKITYHKRNYDALDGVDALVIVTEWNEFRTPDFEKMKKRMARHVIFDGRNIYTEHEMLELGFEYYSIGRPPVVPGK